MVITNSPDFLSKIFAKHYLTALKIVSCTVNRNNKHNNTSNALLGTSALNVKFWHFYNNYGCNTKKMVFSKVHTKNMDLSNFTIGARSHMVPDLILYFMATWPSPNIFSQDKKKISLKIFSLAKFLWRSKKYIFPFLLFPDYLWWTFHFCMFETSIISLTTKALRTQCSINAQMGYCRFTHIFCDARTTYLIRSTCVMYYRSH